MAVTREAITVQAFVAPPQSNAWALECVVMIHSRDRLAGAVFAEVHAVCCALGVPPAVPSVAPPSYDVCSSPFVLATFPSAASARQVLGRCASVKYAYVVWAAGRDADAVRTAFAEDAAKPTLASQRLAFALGVQARAVGSDVAVMSMAGLATEWPRELGPALDEPVPAGKRHQWVRQRQTHTLARLVVTTPLVHRLGKKHAVAVVLPDSCNNALSPLLGQLPSVEVVASGIDAMFDTASTPASGSSSSSVAAALGPGACLVAASVPASSVSRERVGRQGSISTAASRAHSSDLGVPDASAVAPEGVLDLSNTTAVSEPGFFAVCEPLCDGGRALLARLEVRRRPFQGPTSLSEELALLMANLGAVRPGESPDCGFKTGSAP